MLSCNALEDNASLRGTNAEEFAELKDTNAPQDSIGERRLMNFWTVLIQAVVHPPCPPGPLGHHCREGKGVSERKLILSMLWCTL